MNIECDSVDGSVNSRLHKESSNNSGMKFLLCWAFTGSLVIMLSLWCLSAFGQSPRYETMRMSAPKNALRALVIKVGADEDSLEKWKDLLQYWSLYLPCGARTNPVNFEQTDVDLHLYLVGNDTSLSHFYREMWTISSESMRLCFRDFMISDNPTTEQGFYLYSNLRVAPVKANWLNKLIAIVQARENADFIGSRVNVGEGLYDPVGIYQSQKHQVVPLSNAKEDYDLGNVSDYQLVNKEQTALFTHIF